MKSVFDCPMSQPLSISNWYNFVAFNIEPIRKAWTIHKTFSFIVLSFKQLKYEIKHENFGQIYWFLVKKIEIFSSRQNYRLLNWSPTTKFHDAYLWSYIFDFMLIITFYTFFLLKKKFFFRHTVKGGQNYWSTFIDCHLPFRIAAYPV